MLRRFLIAVAGASALLTSTALADDLTWPDLPTSSKTIGSNQLLATACQEAEPYVTPAGGSASAAPAPGKITDADLRACYGAGSTDAWKNVRALAAKYVASAQAYYATHGGGAPKGVCEGGSSETAEITSAASALAAAQDAATKAKADLALKQAAADAADIKVKTQQATLDAAVKAAPNTIQQLSERLAELKIEQKAAQDALAAAAKSAKEADQAVVAATTSAAQAKTNAATKAQNDAVAAKTALHEAIDAATGGAHSPADFEAMLDDSNRLKACVAVRKARLDALGATDAKEQFQKDEKQKTEERTKAHRADLLRKAESAVSGAFSGNGFGELPGSPDKAIFSLMSALGADSRTNGTQLVMTLNLATLIAPNEADRLKLDSTLRNLTLRTNLPLDATDNTPPAGPSTPTDAAAVTPASKAAVSRFTVVLGSSFLDDTDQRLSTHDDCYNAVLAYRPHTEMAKGAEAAADERKDYYDVCNRRAAHAQRLAWRAGAGFITPKGADAGKTKAELLAGAVVWGPTQWLYVDAFYQHILEPAKVRAYGLGFSFGGNVGGSSSGVDSWARIGLDLLGIYTRTLATATDPAKDDVEFRITPNIRAKILGGSVVKLGAGPRILGSDPEHPAILASLALTYDADALIDQVLTTPVAATQ